MILLHAVSGALSHGRAEAAGVRERSFQTFFSVLILFTFIYSFTVTSLHRNLKAMGGGAGRVENPRAVGWGSHITVSTRA